MEERRESKRIEVDIEVQYQSEETFAKDMIVNISKGGMFIKTERPLPVGTKLKITFSIPNKKLPIEVEGVVKWISLPSQKSPIIPGMGIKIEKISEEDIKYIEEFLNKNKNNKK